MSSIHLVGVFQHWFQRFGSPTSIASPSYVPHQFPCHLRDTLSYMSVSLVPLQMCDSVFLQALALWPCIICSINEYDILCSFRSLQPTNVPCWTKASYNDFQFQPTRCCATCFQLLPTNLIRSLVRPVGLCGLLSRAGLSFQYFGFTTSVGSTT